jgi:predicted TPR repeat methyltransferase
MTDNCDPYEASAEDYDRGSVASQWHAPAILFGMLYPHLKQGGAVLDLGIGTGLGTVPFHRAGQKVHGMDSSPSMLKQCAARGLGFNLINHDLTNTPWPYEAAIFDHIVSSGVIHFVGALDAVIAEAARVIAPGGLFGFDFHEYLSADAGDYREQSPGVYTAYDSEYDVRTYRHSCDYVRTLLTDNGFNLKYDLVFRTSPSSEWHFRIFVARR